MGTSLELSCGRKAVTAINVFIKKKKKKVEIGTAKEIHKRALGQTSQSCLTQARKMRVNVTQKKMLRNIYKILSVDKVKNQVNERFRIHLSCVELIE